MSKPLMLGYQKLWEVEDYLRTMIENAFNDAYCDDPKPVKNYVNLRLGGPRPNDWPTDELGRTAREFIKTIQRGVLFYCMEDLLWPSGRNKFPNSDLYWGSVLYEGKDPFHRCGERGTPGLDKVLIKRRNLGSQPVALRTYKDALQYYKVGNRAKNLFPFIDERWNVKRTVPFASAEQIAFLQPIIHSTLYIYGKPPSKIAEDREAEIRYVVGTKMVRKKTRDRLDPPSLAYEHAFRRQLNKLWDYWQSSAPSNGPQPTNKWIREQLGVWDGDDADIEKGTADNDVVEKYKFALKDRFY